MRDPPPPRWKTSRPNNPLWKVCCKFHNVAHSPVWWSWQQRQPTRCLAQTGDERGPGNTRGEETGWGWRDERTGWVGEGGAAAADEGVRLRNQRTDQSAGCRTHAHVHKFHFFSHFFSQQTNEVWKLNWDLTPTTSFVWLWSCVTHNPVKVG